MPVPLRKPMTPKRAARILRAAHRTMPLRKPMKPQRAKRILRFVAEKNKMIKDVAYGKNSMAEEYEVVYPWLRPNKDAPPPPYPLPSLRVGDLPLIVRLRYMALVKKSSRLGTLS